MLVERWTSEGEKIDRQRRFGLALAVNFKAAGPSPGQCQPEPEVL